MRRKSSPFTHQSSPTIGSPVIPIQKYLDRICVCLEDRTAWNLKRGTWTRDKFLEALKTHSWLKVSNYGLVQISRIVDVKFYEQDGTEASCAEFEFA